MTAAAATTEFQSHPNIGAIYDDMIQETTAPPSTMRVKAFTVSTKTFDGEAPPPTNNKAEKRSFSRKNSTDSMLPSESHHPPSSSSSIRPMDRNVARRRGSTDSAFSIYNDDDLWSQRIGEIMNRGIIGGAMPSSITQVQQQQQQQQVRVSSSSHTKFRRCQSTECPSTSSTTNSPSSSSTRHHDRESAWVKKQQFGGKTSLSRRNSIEGVVLSRTNSRSTSPKYIPPIDSFPSDDGSKNVPTTTNVGALSRRNSMTRRSRSPKFVEPLSSSDHDVSREFNGGKIRRHTLAGGVNPFIVTSTTSHQHKDEVLREKRTNGDEDQEGNDGYVIEQVKIVLESLEEPSTPKSAVKDEQRAATVVPKKPFSRHNSIEGVDPSIFPSLPLDDSNTDSYDTDPNLDLALLFDHLVKEDETDVATSEEDDEEEEEKIIQKHIKSKIRRRCSTGGLRTFERENFRNFIEDTEGEEPVRRSVPNKVDGRSSLYRKCSTGGLRTLKRENSKDLYSDDCSLDGKKDGVHVSNDPSFDAYLRKMTQEAVVDTSGDANIINQHVGTSRRRSSIRSVSTFVAGSEDPVDFADFLSRVGQGIPSSQMTVSTAANTSYAEDCCENPREVESVLASSVKKKLPRSIQAPMDESVSSLENSFKGKGSPVSPVKHSAEVNFRSSKSRSIRRLASNDGIKELSKLAQGTEPSTTRRGSCGGIRTPDPEEIVLEDLPRLIKNIDRDLVTERAAYQQRRSSGSGPVSGKKASVMNKGRTGVQRKQLEPPGTSVSEMKAQQTECIQKDEVIPVPLIVLRGAYKPKRRRSSTQSISEDKQRFGEPGNAYNERRRKEQAKS